jgi:hypothetical protein
MSGSGRLALSSRLLVAPKRWRRWIVFQPEDVEAEFAVLCFKAISRARLSLSYALICERMPRWIVVNTKAVENANAAQPIKASVTAAKRLAGLGTTSPEPKFVRVITPRYTPVE